MKILSVLLGIVMIVCGISCMATPAMTYLVIAWIIGFNMVFDAIGNIATWNRRRKAGIADGWSLASAIISLCFGVILLISDALQLTVDIFLVYFASVWLLSQGILRISMSIKLQRVHSALNTEVVGRKWWVVLLMGILMVAVSIFCFIYPGTMAVAIGACMGMAVLVSGCNLVVSAFVL